MVCAFRFDRGAIANVTNVERNAVDEGADRRAALFADGEVVWSSRAHAGAKFASDLKSRAGDGGKCRFTGEHEVSRKPLRREGRADPACTCGQRARAIFVARGPRVQAPPGLPCPSIFRRAILCKARATRRENTHLRRCHSASTASTKPVGSSQNSRMVLK
jgi:hypothetical protein